MSGFRYIGYCEIPNDWADVTLGNEDKRPLLFMRNGLTKSQSDYGGTFKVSRIETISNGIIDESRVKYLSDISREEEDKYLIRKDDILFSHINSDAHLGKTAIANKDYDDLLHGMNLLLFRVNKEIFDPEFLFFTLNYYKNIGVFTAICSRAVNQSSINQGKLKALEVPLPLLPEQQNIAHILSKIQSAIETQEKIIQTTTELKKALMQKLFTEGLKGERQKETEIGLVPESWEVVTFSEGVSVKSGQVDPREEPYSSMIHVGPENIESDTGRLISLQTNEKLKIKSGNYHFTPDDILYSKIRPYLNKAALPNFEGTCSADMYPLKPKKEFFSRHFLFQLLLSETYKKQAMSHQDRTGIPKINRNQLGSILLPKPHLEEQEKIAKILIGLENKIRIASSKQESLKKLFKSMLHHLMTGQIRVKDLRFS